MLSTIFILCVFVMFLECPAYIVNDINTNTLSDDKQNAEDDDQPAISFSFPGTKWCGPGTTSNNYDDLGKEVEADKCCRDHDYCPDYILGRETKYNLTNKAFYSRVTCDCDNQFYQCMKTANTETAKIIGNLYFNGLHTKCFRLDYPTVKCIRRGGWFRSKCLEYSYDNSKQKLYQWFDVLDF